MGEVDDPVGLRCPDRHLLAPFLFSVADVERDSSHASVEEKLHFSCAGSSQRYPGCASCSEGS